MAYENKDKKDFKKWDTKKEETPEEKFNKMYDDFKTDVLRSGILKSVKDHEYYIKPSQRKRMKLAEAKMKAKQNQKRRNQGK
jgi:ribosomal protein S21